MAKTVVCIHTVPMLIKIFNDLGPKYLPDVEFIHVLNAVLVEQVRKKGNPGEEEKQWLFMQVKKAEQEKASAVLVTCTILSGFVDEVRSLVNIPILRIDEEMVKEAILLGNRIGIIITNPDSVLPSTELIKNSADLVHKQIEVFPIIADNAFEAIRNGNVIIHDQLVKNKINELAKKVDVIVLAQASMARVLDTFPESERPVPILSSPILALQKLREMLTS